MIPESEVWVKVGGDKGADTVKILFQLCNVINPNSVINTCVFCVFEGKDTTTNLHVALDHYKPEFEQYDGGTPNMMCICIGIYIDMYIYIYVLWIEIYG